MFCWCHQGFLLEHAWEICKKHIGRICQPNPDSPIPKEQPHVNPQRCPASCSFLGATAAAGAIVAVVFASPAGADPANNTIVPNSAQAQGSFTSGTPFDSGQGIDVVIPSNSVFTSGENLTVEECSAPNGAIPMVITVCNGGTASGPSVTANSDGSFDYINNGGNPLGDPYQVFYTPDPALGNTGTSPACGDTSATECILYIGPNPNDFTQPHLWSQPFFVHPDPNGDSGTFNPGDGTPEVPLAVLLPLAAMGLMAGAVLVRRHMTRSAS